MSDDSDVQRYLKQRVKCKVNGVLEPSMGNVIDCCKPMINGVKINLGVCDRETCREMQKVKK